MLFGFLVQYMHRQFIIAYMHFESLWRCASQNRVVLTVIKCQIHYFHFGLYHYALHGHGHVHTIIQCHTHKLSQ